MLNARHEPGQWDCGCGRRNRPNWKACVLCGTVRGQVRPAAAELEARHTPPLRNLAEMMERRRGDIHRSVRAESRRLPEPEPEPEPVWDDANGPKPIIYDCTIDEVRRRARLAAGGESSLAEIRQRQGRAGGWGL